MSNGGKTKYPVNTWRVTFMLRRQGAIGVFYEYSLLVRAEPDKVTEWAMDDAHAAGFELLGILKTEKLA